MEETSVWLYGPLLDVWGVIRDAARGSDGYRYVSLTYRLSENSVTVLEVVLPIASAPPRTVLRVGLSLGVWYRGRLEGESLWIIRAIEARYTLLGEQELVLYAEHALSLLADRIVAYPSGTAQTRKVKAAETLLKEIVSENMGPGSPADRQLALFRIAADHGWGPTLAVTVFRRNVLRVCREIARASSEQGFRLFFDIPFTGGGFEFRTYMHQRGVARGWGSPAPMVLSQENGTLGEASSLVDHRLERTVVYCGGRGIGHQRHVVVAVDGARVLASAWNRRELWLDARHVERPDALAAVADAALWRRRPMHRMTAVAVDRPGAVYGVDYGYGDVVLVDHMGEVYQGRIHEVTVTVAGGTRRVCMDVRVAGGDEGAVGRLEATLDMLSTQETAWSDDVLMQQLLQSTATYAWFGNALVPGATGDWVDVVHGFPAVATGNPQTVGMANGRRAVQFNGAQWFRTPAFPTVLSQPTAIVAVSRRTGDLSSSRVLYDTRVSPSSHLLRYNSDMSMLLFSGAIIAAANASTTNLIVTVATFNTTASSLRINGVQVVSGDAGDRTLPGLTIGAAFNDVFPFIGQIAMIAVVNGANYAARAAEIEARAMEYYSV